MEKPIPEADNKMEGPNIIGKIELPDDKRKFFSALDDFTRRRLDTLDLRNCGLTGLPEEILSLREQVRYIRLGNRTGFTAKGRPANLIANFSLLKELPRLKGLSLSGMHLQSVQQLSALWNLETLELADCGLSEIQGIGALVNLKELDLSQNQLSKFDAARLSTRLKKLNLSNNRISSLASFQSGTLPHLETLRLSNNSFASEELARLYDRENLHVLELNYSGLYHLGTIEGMPRLKELMVKGNKLTNLEMLDALKELESLDATENQLTDIQQLRRLANLKTLILRKNHIYRIKELQANELLEKLDLSYNELTDIRPLEKLNRLKHLVLDGNNIRDPNPIQALKSLTFLSLAETRLSAIFFLQGLTELKFLNLRNNEIKDLYPLRALLKKDKHLRIYSRKSSPVALNWSGLYFYNNPIENPPKQYLEAGVAAVNSYWDQQEKKLILAEKKVEVNEAKLIIVGNSHTGKSTLSYLLRNRKLPASPLHSTHGLEFSTWTPQCTVGETSLAVNIIDFGGQEYYHDTHHLFFTDRAAYLLLWNPDTNQNEKIETPVGDRDHRELVRHFTVEYWLNAIGIYAGMEREDFEYPSDGFDDEIEMEGDGDSEEEGEIEDELVDNLPYRGEDYQVPDPTTVLLVQTYTDQTGPVFLNMKDLQEKFPLLAGAISIGMNVPGKSFSGIDVLEGYVKTMFRGLGIGPGQTYGESWIKIRKYIEENEKGEFRLMTIKEFQEYFQAHSESTAKYTPEEIRVLCITLDYWGCVLYKYKRKELNDTVVVNPQELTRRINALLTEKVRERNGVLTRDQVLEVVGPETEKTEALVNLLIDFKILYRLKDRDGDQQPQYISPMYLNERPVYGDLFLANFVAYYKIRYDGYFHKGILLDCYHELGKELYFERGRYFYWQWGLVLRRGERIISIEFDDKNLNQVLIRMIRRNKENIGQDEFLQDVLRAFQSINRLYRYDLEISCDGHDFISKEALLKRMRIGLTKFDWRDQKYDVRDFHFLLTLEEVSRPYKRVFVSYSSKDRDYLDRLATHLQLYKNAGVIDYWDDLLLTGRDEWDEKIKDEMNRANILIMLLSPAYLATDYILKEEIPIALKHLNEPMPSKQVFWILLKPCSYELFPGIAKYTIYPIKEKNELSGVARQKAISEQENQDREWVKLLGKILNETE